ncbi:hypothetical protein ACF09L_19215 [Streptomyces sp. NPDC014779]|uniref:hypothetical protein n=1 Tax=Streptomyces sp. NPDC014779 TaxID=3364911 RepID=UPI003700FAE5
MARTAVAYSALVPNSSLADPAGTAVSSGAGNGGQVAAARPELTVLRLSNASGGSGTATILAGALPLAAASGQGSLAVTVANGATQWIGPFESGRFLQSDGSLIVETSVAMTMTAFRVPRNT